MTASISIGEEELETGSNSSTMTSQRNYRVLTLAVAFVASYVVVVIYMYLPAMRNSPILQQLTKAQGDTLLDALPVANFDDNWKKWKEDIRLTNLRNYGLVKNIPGEATLKTYSPARLSLIYHSYLDNNDIICHRKLRMGNVGDGGWEICDDYKWRPVQPCIIYSFGINNDFSFDDQSGFIYGCDVYSFDPSMIIRSHKRSDRVMFYTVGIGGHSGDPERNKKGWVLHSFSNIRQMLNHTKKVIDVVKMDVEGAEWRSLTTMVKEQQLDNVRQLLVEFHNWSNKTSHLLAHLILFHDLERIGFRKFYVSQNAYSKHKPAAFPIMRPQCYEIHFVNDHFKRRLL